MKTKIITTYGIEELTGSAQERAFDWLREGLFADSFWYESVIDDAVRIGALFGLDLESRSWTNSYGFKGKSPSVYWNLDRGQFCSFEGHYEYKKGALAAVKSECPKDEKLHQLIKDLQDIQKSNFYQLRASCSHGRDILRVSVERYDDKELTEGAEDAVTEALNDFGYWILHRLENESEWLSSEENLLEMCEANDYQFDEDGRVV